MGLSSQKCSIFCGFYILVIRSFWCNNRKGIFHQIFFWSSQERQLIRSFWSQQERYNSSDLAGLRMCIDFLCTAELPSHGLDETSSKFEGSQVEVSGPQVEVSMGLSSQKCSIFCGFYILVIRSFWCNNRKGIFHQIFFWSSQERQLIRSFWSQQERYNSSDLAGLRMCIDFLCTAELPSHGLSTSVYNLSGSGTCWVIYPSRPIYTYIYMYRHALWVWRLYIYINLSFSLYI